MTNENSFSLVTAARMAAFAYLFMILAAPFSYGYVYSTLVIPGDAVATIENIQAHSGLFRSGLSVFVLVILADVVVAVGLYYYLRPVNQGLSLMAAWLRIIYVGIFALALNNLFDLLYLVTQVPTYNASPQILEFEVLQQAHKFDYGWLLGLVFFGAHLLLIGSLIIRSIYMPALLGWLVVLAGLAYITDSFAHFMLENYAAYKDLFLMMVLIPATLGELSLCAWLFIRGKAGANKA